MQETTITLVLPLVSEVMPGSFPQRSTLWADRRADSGDGSGLRNA